MRRRAWPGKVLPPQLAPVWRCRVWQKPRMLVRAIRRNCEPLIRVTERQLTFIAAHNETRCHKEGKTAISPIGAGTYMRQFTIPLQPGQFFQISPSRLNNLRLCLRSSGNKGRVAGVTRLDTVSADAQAGSAEPSLPVNQRRCAERLIAIKEFHSPRRHSGSDRRSYSCVKRHFLA